MPGRAGSIRSRTWLAFFCLAVASAMGCSGLSDAPNYQRQSPTSGSVTVAVLPATPNVEVYGSQQFTATVTGTSNQAVAWQVNGVTGGNTTNGIISSSGLYKAPFAVPVAGQQATTVTVKAVSQAQSSASGSATVTIYAPNQNQQSAPIELGTSGGNANDSNSTACCSGTLGSLVTQGGTPYILSNNHVLAISDSGHVGDPITQPGLVDANCSATGTTTVAHLSQFYNLENGSGTPVDAAIAQVVNGSVDSSGNILLLGAGTDSNGVPLVGAPQAGVGEAPVVGGAVAKSGRSTGLTCSTIEAVDVSVGLAYWKGCGQTGSTFNVNYTNQVAVSGGAFSAEGDSGSLIVDQDTAAPVALLWGGGSIGSSGVTLGNPVADVLSAFQSLGTSLTFVGGAAHAVAGCTLAGPSSTSASPQQASAAGLLLATAVRDRHAAELSAYPSVQALGVGASLDRAGDPAILFFVTKGVPHNDIPAQVDGVRTRIIEGTLFAKRGAISAEESAALEQSVPLPPAVSRLSEGEMTRARAVHAAHVNALMKEPGVQGLGITASADSPGEAALMIYWVLGAPHGEMPAAIDGLRTRVQETNRFVAWVGPGRACSTKPRHK